MFSALAVPLLLLLLLSLSLSVGVFVEILVLMSVDASKEKAGGFSFSSIFGEDDKTVDKSFTFKCLPSVTTKVYDDDVEMEPPLDETVVSSAEPADPSANASAEDYELLLAVHKELLKEHLKLMFQHKALQQEHPKKVARSKNSLESIPHTPPPLAPVVDRLTKTIETQSQVLGKVVDSQGKFLTELKCRVDEVESMQRRMGAVESMEHRLGEVERMQRRWMKHVIPSPDFNK